VKKAASSARVELSQSERFPPEHEQSARSRAPSDLRAYGLELPLDIAADSVGLVGMARRISQVMNRLDQVSESTVTIAERADSGAGELCRQLQLRSIDDDHVGLESEDSLSVRVQQRTHVRQGFHLDWELVKVADANNLVSGANGEQHLGHGWDE
jgi:hypothetical protein